MIEGSSSEFSTEGMADALSECSVRRDGMVRRKKEELGVVPADKRDLVFDAFLVLKKRAISLSEKQYAEAIGGDTWRMGREKDKSLVYQYKR